MTVRPMAVAGQFYPATKNEILNTIKTTVNNQEDSINKELAKKNIIGGISPHAGYIFSLPEAVHLFRILQLSKQNWDQVVLLNPNHTGFGASLSVDTHEQWESPLGKVKIDSKGLKKEPNDLFTITHEIEAQKKEHSAEVFLPLLTYFLKDFSLLPVCMGDSSYHAACFVAEKLYQMHLKTGKSPLIIASSDFTHFETPQRGRELDNFALEALLNFDSKEFYRRICERKISICGHGPIMVLLEYAKKVASLPKVKILKRGHSGEAPYFRGIEQDSVVDYVSLLVYS
ncbi:MAG: AmmeMemoRadiSam system protein B [Treponema sp. CETP13]|nr:MAG: AmmeMemoRadiSam system protein B [Treponema sp. CETP13]